MTPRNVVSLYNGVCKGARTAPWCGCGSPASAWLTVRDLLLASEAKELDEALGAWPDGVQQIVSGALEGMELTDHGGSHYYSRPTALGRKVLDSLRTTTLEEMEEACDDMDALSCGGEGCPGCAAIAALGVKP